MSDLTHELASRGAPRPRGAVFKRMRLSVVVASLVTVVAAAAAAFPRWCASADPYATEPSARLSAPSLGHWFGTDHLGRDVYSRVVHAAGVSLSATIAAVVLAALVGSAVGVLAATTGTVVESVVLRSVDVLLSVPALVLALAIITALGFGTVNVAFAVGISLVANFARLMHGEVLRVHREQYVEAASVSGVRWPRVVARHLVPNAAGPVIALATAEFGMAVLSISALSFLGFGTSPPTPEWGSMIAEGRNYLAVAWWISTLPGAVVVAVVLATHRLSRTVYARGAAG